MGKYAGATRTQLFNMAKDGDSKALDYLLQRSEEQISNIADSVLEKYNGAIIDKDDLMQVGRITIIKAVNNNSDYDYHISTAFNNSIKQAMLLEIAHHGYEIKYTKRQIIRKFNESYDADDISNDLYNRIGYIYDKYATPEYYNDDLLKNLVDEYIEEALSKLTEKEKDIIRKRFYDELFLDEIGKDYGVQRERIRQIEAKALRKLRHPNISKYFEDLLEIYD